MQEKISAVRDKSTILPKPHQHAKFNSLPNNKINFADRETKNILTVKKTREQMETQEKVNSIQPNPHY